MPPRPRPEEGTAGLVSASAALRADPAANIGTAGRDVIVAEGGNDEVRGCGGGDLLCGGGKDSMFGGGGRESIVRRGPATTGSMAARAKTD